MENEKLVPDTDRKALADSLVSVGLSWARYGLSIGRGALENSARSLEATAKVLGNLANDLEKKEIDGVKREELPTKS